MAIIKNPLVLISSGGGGGDTPENGVYHFHQQTAGVNWSASYTSSTTVNVAKYNDAVIKNVQANACCLLYYNYTSNVTLQRAQVPRGVTTKQFIIPTITSTNIQLSYDKGSPNSYWAWLMDLDMDIELSGVTITKLQDGSYKMVVGSGCTALWKRNYYPDLYNTDDAVDMLYQVSNSFGSTNISEYDLSNCTISGVADRLFVSDRYVKKVKLPNNTDTIKRAQFRWCYELEEVTNISNVTTIEKFAFDHCQKLPSISLPNATTIGASTFNYCKSLTTANLPNATSIGEFIFNRCELLSSLTLSTTITTIPRYGFGYCRSLTSVDFANVTTVGEYAFEQCSGITSVNLPSATTLGNYAFSQCSGITSVNIPNVTTIPNSGFYYCSALTSINLPKVTTISTRGFASCSSLTSITLGANSVCSLSSTNAIPASATQHITIYVPSDLIASYQTASNWNTLYNNGYITFQAIS